jgi:hypothetical protein
MIQHIALMDYFHADGVYAGSPTQCQSRGVWLIRCQLQEEDIIFGIVDRFLCANRRRLIPPYLQLVEPIVGRALLTDCSRPLSLLA